MKVVSQAMPRPWSKVGPCLFFAFGYILGGGEGREMEFETEM